ncbi:MAG TPA: pseudouridine synthase [Acidimicrobiia bacterium]|nr:pseudouridine synthase [Acidimicrobiia bacterium]
MNSVDEGPDASRPVRLQKAIADAGLMSRRRAEELIATGRVTIDGLPARLGDRVDPTRQKVQVDGSILPIRPDSITYLLNKPPGVVCTAIDPQGRPTVVGLVPKVPRVFPVGRLDTESEGLILLTNDGDLALRLTHPRFGVTKTYLTWLEGVPVDRDLARLRRGVQLEDGPARPVSVRRKSVSADRTLVEIVVAEGRKREVRRMFEAIGFPVARLVRTAIGPLRDQKLKPGEWRLLTPSEVLALHRAEGSPEGAPTSV